MKLYMLTAATSTRHRWQIFMASSYACWRMAPGIIITRTLEIRLLRHMLEMFASPTASESSFSFFCDLYRCVWTTRRWGNNDLMFSNMFRQDSVLRYLTRRSSQEYDVYQDFSSFLSFKSSGLSIFFKFTDFHKHCVPQARCTWFDYP